MLSAARIAQYNDCATGRTVQGSNSVTGKRSLHQGGYRVAGVVSWRVSLRTHIHLVPTLRMCGAIPPLPYIPSWRACGQRGWGYERASYKTVKLAKCGTSTNYSFHGRQQLCNGRFVRSATHPTFSQRYPGIQRAYVSIFRLVYNYSIYQSSRHYIP